MPRWVMLSVRLADRSSKVSNKMSSQGSAASSIHRWAILDMISWAVPKRRQQQNSYRTNLS